MNKVRNLASNYSTEMRQRLNNREGCGVRSAGGTMGVGRRGGDRNPANHSETIGKPQRKDREQCAAGALLTRGQQAESWRAVPGLEGAEGFAQTARSESATCLEWSRFRVGLLEDLEYFVERAADFGGVSEIHHEAVVAVGA
jgi:hypothetical protein